MNVTFACPHCEKTASGEIVTGADALFCPYCKTTFAVSADALAGGRLSRCLICPSRDVFLRKDFPQRLGVLIVSVGFLASTVTWAYSRPIWTFAILFSTALVDVVLYLVMPNAVMCYHCGALYRGLPHSDAYGEFNLETHERHRQQKIRLGQHAQASAQCAYAAQPEGNSGHCGKGTSSGR